jgi:hypothetical protein
MSYKNLGLENIPTSPFLGAAENYHKDEYPLAYYLVSHTTISHKGSRKKKAVIINTNQVVIDKKIYTKSH